MSTTMADRLARLGSKLLQLEQSLTNLPPTNDPLILYDDLLADPCVRLEALLSGAAPTGQADVPAVLRPAAPATDALAAFEQAGPWQRHAAARYHATPGGGGREHTEVPGGGAAPLRQRHAAASSGRPDESGRSSGAAHRTVPRRQPLRRMVPNVQAPAAPGRDAPGRDAHDADPSPPLEAFSPSIQLAAAASAQPVVVAPAAMTVGEVSPPSWPGAHSENPAAPPTGSIEPERAAGATRLSRGGASLLSILQTHKTPGAEAKDPATKAPARAPNWTAAGSWTERVAEAAVPAGAHDPADSRRLPQGVELPPPQRTPAMPTSGDPAVGLAAKSRATVAAESPAVAAEQVIEHLADRLELALLRTYGTSGS